jgi:hypothetical protein
MKFMQGGDRLETVALIEGYAIQILKKQECEDGAWVWVQLCGLNVNLVINH